MTGELIRELQGLSGGEGPDEDMSGLFSRWRRVRTGDDPLTRRSRYFAETMQYLGLRDSGMMPFADCAACLLSHPARVGESGAVDEPQWIQPGWSTSHLGTRHCQGRFAHCRVLRPLKNFEAIGTDTSSPPIFPSPASRVWASR